MPTTPSLEQYSKTTAEVKTASKLFVHSAVDQNANIEQSTWLNKLRNAFRFTLFKLVAPIIELMFYVSSLFSFWDLQFPRDCAEAPKTVRSGSRKLEEVQILKNFEGKKNSMCHLTILSYHRILEKLWFRSSHGARIYELQSFLIRIPPIPASIWDPAYCNLGARFLKLFSGRSLDKRSSA